MKQIVVVVVLCGLSGLCGCANPKKDLDALCAIYTEEASKPGDLAARQTRIGERGTAAMQSDAGKMIFRTLGSAAARDRYAILKQGALEVGYADYSCPAAEKLFAELEAPKPVEPPADAPKPE